MLKQRSARRGLKQMRAAQGDSGELDILGLRLSNQRLSGKPFQRPEEVVKWLGAVQAQDYAAGKWALGLRTRELTDACIEQAFDRGAILRTHVLRPTWHFVLPEDIHWMLALTAPRVKAVMAHNEPRLGLDSALYTRTNDLLAKALQGGNQLTRQELASVLRRAGIRLDDTLRLGHMMMRAELDAVICSGARRGKQHTYALLDEQAPHARILAREEALAELARRYFTSRGPATLNDFAWWSGLTVADGSRGVDMNASLLSRRVVEGRTYWFAESPAAKIDSPFARLLPNYDEYIVGYTDRSAIFDLARARELDPRGIVFFLHTILIDGRIVGVWKRTFQKEGVLITTKTLDGLSEAESQALAGAIRRFGEFLGQSILVD